MTNINTEELEALMREVPELPGVLTAYSDTQEALFPLAVETLRAIAGEIKLEIQRGKVEIVKQVDVPRDSPAIALVTAALRKREYDVTVNGDDSYSQFIISWKIAAKGK
jgi:hypothetical protein